MAKKLAKGIELLADEAGDGPFACKGCRIVYSAQTFLRRGHDVTRDGEIIARAGACLQTAICDGSELICHSAILGKRQSIAGIERSLFGMQAGGYREVLISPHLGYGETGVPGIIPANALLRVRLWVHALSPAI